MRLIDADALIGELHTQFFYDGRDRTRVYARIQEQPTIELTLYGYKIEHLALIARVMQKEGVSPEKAVQTFVDMKRIIEMLIDEIQEKVERTMMEVEHEKDTNVI